MSRNYWDHKETISKFRKVLVTGHHGAGNKITATIISHDFLLPYNEILSSANSLIIEWHSWHRGGRSVLEIQKIVQ